MKSTILNLNKRVLVVEIPKDVKIEQTSETNLKLNDTEIIGLEGLPFEEEFDVNFICKGSELSEEIAKGLVDSRNINYEDIYFDYKEDCWFDESMTALDSFISAIEANQMFWGKNPKSHPTEIEPTNRNHFDKLSDDFLEAESKTFHPEQVILFEIL